MCRLGSHASLQFSAQAFNVRNHGNYALSNGNVFSNGGVTTALATQGYALRGSGRWVEKRAGTMAAVRVSLAQDL
jgi:hypothetical protein